jgi:periplasmic protein TonB
MPASRKRAHDRELPHEPTAAPRTGLRARLRSPYLRYAAALVVIALLFAGALYLLIGHDDMPPPRQVREITIVNITPPPPPPPQKLPEQKMIEQPKMAEPEFKEDKPVEQPKDQPKNAKNEEPPGPLSLDAKPTGPGDLFNLGGKPGGSPYGGGGGGGQPLGLVRLNRSIANRGGAPRQRPNPQRGHAGAGPTVGRTHGPGEPGSGLLDGRS